MRWAGTRIATIFLVSLMGFPALAGKVGLGEPAPALSLNDLEGNRINLSGLRGKVVLLHFWATWCPICREEMPLLEEVYRAHPGDVAILAINLGERKKKVAEYVWKTGFTFPILLDPRGNAASGYDVLALPTTLIVDPDGLLAGEIPMGKLERDDLERRLAPFIGRKPKSGEGSIDERREP